MWRLRDTKLSLHRVISEAVSPGPAGGEPVQELLAGRENHAIVQLHTCFWTQAPTDVSASHVVMPRVKSNQQLYHVTVNDCKFRGFSERDIFEGS